MLESQFNARRLRSAALLVLLAAGPRSVWASAGVLDPTFGEGGIVTTDVTLGGTFLGGHAFSVTTQAGGRVVATGVTWGDQDGDPGLFALTRYDRFGRPDPNFGEAGVVSTAVGGPSDTRDAAFQSVAQSDGKLVSVGISCTWADSPPCRLALVRYDVAGIPDPTFGVGGKVLTAAPSAETARLTLLPDGRIVAAGWTAEDSTREFLVVRYTDTGSLDPSFGNAGIVRTTLAGDANGVEDFAIDAAGRIVAVGFTDVGTGPTQSTEFLIVRYLSDGTLDPSFGSAGIVVVGPGASNIPFAVAVQADGKIVVGGHTADDHYGSGARAMLLRLNADGSLDPSFGVGGVVRVVGAPISSLAIQLDGKVVAAAGDLLRFDADGSLDATFGNGGVVSTESISASGVAIQPDGKLLVASNVGYSFRLARYEGEVCGSAAPIFPWLTCRLAVLRAVIGDESGPFASGLLSRLDRVVAREALAANANDPAAARQRLRGALHQLVAVKHRLRSWTGRRRIGSDARDEILSVADPIVTEIEGLLSILTTSG